MIPLSTYVAQAHINDMHDAACRYRLRKQARIRRTNNVGTTDSCARDIGRANVHP